MKIILSSTNKAKKEAVKRTFSKAFPSDKIEIQTFSVESGVSETPTSAEEGIQGALNRIENLKELM